MVQLFKNKILEKIQAWILEESLSFYMKCQGDLLF